MHECFVLLLCNLVSNVMSNPFLCTQYSGRSYFFVIFVRSQTLHWFHQPVDNSYVKVSNAICKNESSALMPYDKILIVNKYYIINKNLKSK